MACRASTARGYLYPAMNRPNLVIQIGAVTTRILIEKGRAAGVEYIQAERARRQYAECEVILCGGAYDFPQLLMLSGSAPPTTCDQLASSQCTTYPALAKIPPSIPIFSTFTKHGASRG